MPIPKPVLTDPPPTLTRECADPVSLAGAAVGQTAAASLSQAQVVEGWATDRAALVSCKRRHKGLVAFYRVRDEGLR